MSKTSTRQWFVCDMDAGVLPIEPTRHHAVRWLRRLLGGTVRARHSFGPGSFAHVVGHDNDDQASAFVVRGDRAADSGWDPQQVPLYPLAEDPFERVDRAEGLLEQSAQRRA